MKNQKLTFFLKEVLNFSPHPMEINIMLIKEAEHAQSQLDFLNKMNIALKEANETEYWLMLLKESDYLDEKEFNSINADCSELIRILISIVKTTKEKTKKK